MGEGAEPGRERGHAEVGVEAGEGACGAEGFVAALGEVEGGDPARALDHADQRGAVVDLRGEFVPGQACLGARRLEFGREQG